MQRKIFKISKLRKIEEKYLQNRYAKHLKSPRTLNLLKLQFLTLTQRPAWIIVLARDVIDEPWPYIRYNFMCKPGT